MSISFGQSNRQVIPRWLSYTASNALRLLQSSYDSRYTLGIEPNTGLAASAWKEDHTWSTAQDYVAEAILLSDYENSEARFAAQYLLSNSPARLTLPRILATHYLAARRPPEEQAAELENLPNHKVAIATLRLRTAAHPFDPVSWADLALNYALAGSRDRSIRAMQTAVGLADGNRFILRSAARCFLHFGEPDRALHLLQSSELCKTDPWVAASEIAVAESAALKSKCVRHGRALLAAKQHSNLSCSELSASIGTLELSHGSARKAKMFIRDSLVDPTENSLAQAEWISNHLKSVIHEPPSRFLASYEAQAHHMYHQKAFQESLNAARSWTRFQPLSSRPLTFASFVSSVVLNDDRQTIDLLSDSNLAKEGEPILLNNLAFAYARQGELDQATESLSVALSSNLGEHQKLVLAATAGLISFRRGNTERARQLYQQAVRGLEATGSQDAATVAKTFWALEEVGAKSELAASLAADTLKRINKGNIAELEIYKKDLLASINE